MKLVVQIPAFNEEATIGKALAALPRKVAGFSEVSILVIDDGSSDRTAELARSGGADRLVRLTTNRGLAEAFSAGLAESLAMGADVIVNFDADLQYDPADIPALTAPILEGRADFTIGDRGPGQLAHFSPAKRLLQRLGSWVVRQASGIQVTDAVSGFRALSREAARRINVFSKLTYTLETLIQAGYKGLRVVSVPVTAHPPIRPSRLFTSTAKYVLLQGSNVLRITALYKPLKIFSVAAGLFVAAGAALCVRFLCYYFFGANPGGHVQSLILAAVLIVVGFQTFLIALLADLVAINRRLLEEMKLREQVESRGSSVERLGPSSRP
jgi:glycosyltransferase involved in cell wall biosynthesis